MSTLAKVFVVIVLICSALLAASSATLFTLRVNYKDMYEAERQAKQAVEDRLNDELARVKAEYDASQRANADLTSSLADYERLVTDLRRTERDHQNQVDALRSQVENHERTSQTRLARISELEREKDDLSRQASELRGRNESLAAEAERKKDELFTAVQERDTFKTQLDTALTEVRRLTQLMEDMQHVGVRDPQPTTPKINAVVVRADVEPQEFVVLSVGEDDGVNVGTQFTVYRRLPDGGSQYVGLVDAIRVEPEFTICRIQQDMRNRGPEGELIAFQEKDLATTHISD